MPPKFHYPDDVDVWQRLRWDLTQHSRAAHFMEAVARLSRRTTFDRRRAPSTRWRCGCSGQFASTNKGWAARLVPLLDEQLGYYRPALMVLFGAVGLLLVIGCLNVASLLLTRALSREREIAVRIAMGAAPRQLVTQLLAESLVLSVAGARRRHRRRRGGAAAHRGAHAGDDSAPRRGERRPARARPRARRWSSCTTVFFGLVPALLLLQAASSCTDLQVGRARQLARRAPHLLGAGRRRGRAGLRAAGQLGAARAHGRRR